MKKLPSFTVVISTRSAPPSLLKTVRSIRNSTGVSDFPFLLVADNVPQNRRYREVLKRNKVRIVSPRGAKTLAAKYQQALTHVKTDLVVLTQDDLLFDPACLSVIQNTFAADKTITMTCTHIGALPPQNLFERSLQSAPRIIYRMASRWNSGDNYLHANGQAMAFRVKFLKKLTFEKRVVNLDTYFYFENRHRGGVFKYLPKAVIYNKTPGNMKDHLNQSSRFQNSFPETVQYIQNVTYAEDYKIPRRAVIEGLLLEGLTNPLFTAGYLAIFVYTRIFKLQAKKVMNPLWKPDLTTKHL